MKKILLGTAAALCLTTVAGAADLGVRMPVKAPPMMAPPVFSWTGCYLGGFVGGAWAGDTRVTTYDTTNPANWYAYKYSTDASFIGGGTAGCNWQPVGSAFVLGLEGEVGYLSIEGSALDPILPAASGSIAAASKVGDWYGMITGRLGYSFDRTLVYVKGGAAFVNVESAIAAIDLNGGQQGVFAGSASDTVATWTVGGGVEWAFDPNWSVKAEYMYIGLDKTQTLVAPAPLVPAGWRTEFDGIQTAKVGLNYRFGGASFARY